MQDSLAFVGNLEARLRAAGVTPKRSDSAANSPKSTLPRAPRFPERANTPIGPGSYPVHGDGFGERPIPRRRARGSSVPPAEGPSSSLLLERRLVSLTNQLAEERRRSASAAALCELAGEREQQICDLTARAGALHAQNEALRGRLDKLGAAAEQAADALSERLSNAEEPHAMTTLSRRAIAELRSVGRGASSALLDIPDDSTQSGGLLAVPTTAGAPTGPPSAPPGLKTRGGTRTAWAEVSGVSRPTTGDERSAETPLQASATGMTARASASELEEKVEIVFRYACGQPLGERKADLPRMSSPASSNSWPPRPSHTLGFVRTVYALFGRVLTAQRRAARISRAHWTFSSSRWCWARW